MAAISGMATLEELNIGYTGVGDAGVASLGRITSLRVLNMDSCDITDGCARAGIPTIGFVSTCILDCTLSVHHNDALKRIRILESQRPGTGGQSSSCLLSCICRPFCSTACMQCFPLLGCPV